LSRAFVHEREYPVLDNEYRNSESQRSVQATNSRKRWRLAKRLTPAQLGALRDFYDARKGATGQAVAGRYTVRFAVEWSQSVSLGRADVNIELIEVA
jgi:hypothetical protein